MDFRYSFWSSNTAAYIYLHRTTKWQYCLAIFISIISSHWIFALNFVVFFIICCMLGCAFFTCESSVVRAFDFLVFLVSKCQRRHSFVWSLVAQNGFDFSKFSFTLSIFVIPLHFITMSERHFFSTCALL